MPDVRKTRSSACPSSRACSTARADAADQILRLALDPEVRRIIRDVGKNRDQGRSRQRGVQALAQRAIEIGDQRDHQIRPVCSARNPEAIAPVAFETCGSRDASPSTTALDPSVQPFFSSRL